MASATPHSSPPSTTPPFRPTSFGNAPASNASAQPHDPATSTSATAAAKRSDQRWHRHPTLDLFIDAHTGLAHDDPYGPPLPRKRPTGTYGLRLEYPHPYTFHMGHHHRLSKLVWEALTNREIPRWNKDCLKFRDGDPWNTHPSNLFFVPPRPRGRPRKERA